MIGTPEQDAFVTENRWAVVTSLRADGSPTNSVIFYAREGDELIFSTTESRLKAKTIRKNPNVAITVLDEGAPFRFVTVEGKATIQTEDIVPGHVAVNNAMRREEFSPPEGYEAGLKSAGRVLIRLKASRVSGVTNRG
ncbi:MAG: PPOX class F420-dependent oxidoreductase [Anaerolineaceae bacterium]